MEFLDDHGDGYIALALPVESGSIDFIKYKLMLEKIDQLLDQSHLESRLKEIAIKNEREEDERKKKERLKIIKENKGKKEEERESVPVLRPKSDSQIRRYASYALRCTIARFLSQLSYRSFSVRLADSILLRDFCGYFSPHSPDETPSKSTLQRFESQFDTETLREVADMLLLAASDEKSDLFNKHNGLLYRCDTDYLFLDSTCAKLDIHFPVDWVLLKDSVKSIIQSIIQIRSYGILHRMPTPEEFLSNVNNIAIQMSNSSNGPGSKKQRKTIFRKLKKLLRNTSEHGYRYLQKLESNWKDTDLSEAQKNQIVKKLKHTLDLVPDVIYQAEERIIGERQVPNDKKILSLHEEHAKVYNRGKAGSQVEFGLQLLLGENLDGMITHWDLYKNIPRPDYKHTQDVINRIESMKEECRPHQLVGDRGFFSANSEKKIENADLISNMCPKNPKVLKERLSDEGFKDVAKRRAQTEGRVGIMKNNFLGRKIRVHGFEAQERHVAWAVLAHNLWVLSRFPYIDLLEDEAA